MIVIGYRSRGHASRKNSSLHAHEIQAAKIFIKEYNLTNEQVFVVGNGLEVERVCASEGYIHLKKLADFVSVLKNPNTICHIAPATGTTLLSFHSAECPILLLDHVNASKLQSVNAVLGGTPSHFFRGGIIPWTGNNVSKNLANGILQKEIHDGSVIKIKP